MVYCRRRTFNYHAEMGFRVQHRHPASKLPLHLQSQERGFPSHIKLLGQLWAERLVLVSERIWFSTSVSHLKDSWREVGENHSNYVLVTGTRQHNTDGTFNPLYRTCSPNWIGKLKGRDERNQNIRVEGKTKTQTKPQTCWCGKEACSLGEIHHLVGGSWANFLKDHSEFVGIQCTSP